MKRFGLTALALLGAALWLQVSPPRTELSRDSQSVDEPQPLAQAPVPAAAALPLAQPASKTVALVKQGSQALAAAILPAPRPESKEAPALPWQPERDDTVLTTEQFRTLTNHTLSQLPTRADLRDVTADEAHGYPEPLAKAGPLLGQIAQAVEKQPSFKGPAAEFYLSCVLDRELLTPVRALCYSHIKHDPKAPQAVNLPPEVVRLARFIPEES